jgi:hypothetical protein
LNVHRLFLLLVRLFVLHDFNIENEPHNVKPLDEIYFAC